MIVALFLRFLKVSLVTWCPLVHLQGHEADMINFRRMLDEIIDIKVGVLLQLQLLLLTSLIFIFLEIWFAQKLAPFGVVRFTSLRICSLRLLMPV